MKTCGYCGKENDAAAVTCSECGQSDFPDTEKAAHPGDAVQPEGLNNLPNVFRILVLFNLLAYGFGFFLAYTNTQADSIFSWHGYGAVFFLPHNFYWLLFLLSVAVTVGVYSFSASARMLFLWLVCLDTIYTLFAGAAVQLPLTSFLATLVTLADGAILALAYLSPLKTQFR